MNGLLCLRDSLSLFLASFLFILALRDHFICMILSFLHVSFQLSAATYTPALTSHFVKQIKLKREFLDEQSQVSDVKVSSIFTQFFDSSRL